jgi:heat shock protein HslJ
LALIPVLLLVFGCQSGPAAAPDEKLGASSLVGSEWACAEIAGAAIDAGLRAPTLSFNDDGRVTGSTAVNRYNAPYHLSAREKGTGLRFGLLVSTRMAADADAMKVESSFTRALESVDAATMEGGRLKLWSGDSCVLAFDRAAK